MIDLTQVQRRLDRIPYFDERSRNYRAVEGIEDATLRSYTWRCDQHLDQGQEGACVGFGWTHELCARPKVIVRDAPFAFKLYERAKQLDDFPGEDYDGTSVIAGAKALQEIKNSRGRSFIVEYRWAFGLEDVVRTIGHKGPVVLGVNWYNDMFTPDENNFLSPTGGVAGGHCILSNGVKVVFKGDNVDKTKFASVDLDKSFVRLHNSWGTSYGDNGDVYMTLNHLNVLLQNNGEACIPTHRTFDR